MSDSNNTPLLPIRLWCVTVYVFTPDGNKTLMINHRKLKRWVSPGGKIDPNELPDVAAVRETLEETGVRVKLLGGLTPVDDGLIKPYGVQLNTVIPGEKDHIDLIYLAVPIDDGALVLNTQETDGIAWMDVEAVLDPAFNTFNQVRQWVAFFHKELRATQ